MRFIDITGRRFNRLVALSRIEGKYWLFQCDCGVSKICKSNDAKAGKVGSCGCLRKENQTTHGLSKTSTYSIWNAMIKRCYSPKTKVYKNYGGRGIKVCSRWKTFENFVEDMGLRPEGMSIDRIDTDLGYSASNCRWATVATQNRNKRNSINVTISQTTMNLKDWSEELGIHYDTLYYRYRTGKRGKDLIRKVVSNAR